MEILLILIIGGFLVMKTYESILKTKILLLDKKAKEFGIKRNNLVVSGQGKTLAMVPDEETAHDIDHESILDSATAKAPLPSRGKSRFRRQTSKT